MMRSTLLGMMVVVGMYFQWKVIRKSTYISQLNSKGLKDYSAIMKGAKPKAREKMSSRLQREFKGISDKQSGNIDSGSGDIHGRCRSICNVTEETLACDHVR